jgi:hypothetical protein
VMISRAELHRRLDTPWLGEVKYEPRYENERRARLAGG